MKVLIGCGYVPEMGYWIKRIALKSGEVVTEQELREDENRFDGPAPVVGDFVEVQCRGRKFMAEIVWGNWADRVHADEAIVPLRVREIGLNETRTPLRFPPHEAAQEDVERNAGE